MSQRIFWTLSRGTMRNRGLDAQLVVIDWDGTIADSIKSIVDGKTFVATQYGMAIPELEVVKSVIGRPIQEAMALCFPSANMQAIPHMVEDFRNFMSVGGHVAPLFPGVRLALRKLKTIGMWLAVATSKSRVELDRAMQHHGLGDMFDVTCCGDEHEPKPHVAMSEYIERYLGLAGCARTMVGDTVTDGEFAANMNAQFIGVTFGAHSRQQLLQWSPVAIVDKWDEVVTVVAK